ncbi:DNA-directed RNA polymerase III subunit RPC5 [Micractinium conductrix]|uniref:DNA-directed RNA polymerase III subunit RPC5 n=1 Tax=Micractinium conductrix TaxID=554055 RepID=A0A2P6VED7_9CHLO|nr:DNA-directed RNA polymerase III subunit RPC5 [Micractinium conductrix]|eukprot:PSC72452.1 DNA-directed RNA polymerase III subunit RPC5 [Micractinium conductrix]
MAAPEGTSLQVPSKTPAGLPGDGDRVVRELDVYLCNGELGGGTQTFLLQFPLRPPWRPYHTDNAPLQNVQLKPKVKKMQCEVPLDTRNRNYNTNAEPSRQIKAAVLQSARLDMRTSFAAGFVEEDRLLLFPIDEALQLRPSLAHLDKEKEAAAAGKKKGKGEEEEEEEQKPPELMQLTVQVKRRETEAQAEARLRSYAHLAAQEEADQWVPLEYHGEASELAQGVWQRLASVEAEDVAHTLSREHYLDTIVPGSSTLHGHERSANWAAGAMSARDQGRPGSAGGALPPAEEVAVAEELQPGITTSTLTLLRAAQVVSIDQIRAVLAHSQEAALKNVAAGSSDAALHGAVTASGEITHLRQSYFATKLGNAALDPLRNVLIELLKENEQLRRSDIFEAAKAKGLTVSDTLYSKVVKELCTSRGSIWSLNATLTGRLSSGPLAAHRQQAPTSQLSDERLHKWMRYAASRQCSLLDSDYSQIFADLAPFRTAGISAADVAAAAAALPATGMLALVGGEAWEEGPDGELGAPTRRMWGGIRYYKKLLADFESDLPDMKVLINFGDKPRSWTGAVPPADADALARGALSVQDAWERHGCDAAVGAGMRCKHGLFQPGPFFGARGPLPIFSGWRIDGCFSDILLPHAWNNKGNVTRLTLNSGCPLAGGAWGNKSDMATWRGSTSGSKVRDDMAPEEWRAFHRMRLVELSRERPDILDAQFTGFVQCQPEACAAMEAHYGKAAFAQAGELYAHKYTVIVDGNGAAARLGPTLCSGSVAFNAQLFREWFFFRLRPFKHFIPIKPDYSDLVQQFTLCNDLPALFPNVSKGISVHWHGWRMADGAQWHDGAGYVTQCPVFPGDCSTSRWVVQEAPAGGANAMPLSRPFDAARQSNETGGWQWVNNPQALLINGKGNWMDCKLNPGGVTTPPVTCNVTDYWVPPGASAVQPWMSAASLGCAHENFTVEAGKTYLFRVASVAQLAYQTICFEGHDVTLVAADAVPIEPIAAAQLNASRPGCVDINSGQRYDVLLTADQPAGNYWISTHVQYRPGSPSGYAVLHYQGTPDALPATAPPQPQSVGPWTLADQARIVMSSALLGAPADEYEGFELATQKVPAADLSLTFNITQPLMNQTGQLRWALNNVVGLRTPPCDPLLDLLHANPLWMQTNLVSASQLNGPGFESTGLGKQVGESGKVQVFLTTADGSNPPPIYPVAGTHLVPLKRGQVVELVLQNLPANSFNGDYRVPAGQNRTAMEQHPFHLHGHHFWVLGSGEGIYSPAGTNVSTNSSALNTLNPPRRDTATLPQAGWVVVRFVADNPAHELMGQAAMFVTDPTGVPTPPLEGRTQCATVCTYNAAPWAVPTVKQEFGSGGFELPRGG